MRKTLSDIIPRTGPFSKVAIITSFILLIPLTAMQFTSEVSWDETDFIATGALLFGTGSVFVLVSRRLPRNSRIVTGFLLGAAALFVWAELAVGIFTTLGS